MTYSSTVLALPGLLWWSRLADTSTPFTDASGGGHNLTWGTGVTGNVSGATVDGNKASGAGTGGSTIASASWMDTTGSWWAAIWVKSSTTGTERTALSRYTNNTNYAFQVGFSTTNKALIRLRNSAATNNSVVGATTITDGNWHLIVGTWDGSVIKVYVDGVLDGTSSAFTGTLTTGQTFRLNGGAGAMTSGDGLDEAMFGGGSGTTSFLSATDVTNLYTAATSAGGTTGTLATTLAGATMAASGTETITGTLASTLAGATLAASGTEKMTGTLATTLAGATLVASGSSLSGISGTLATTLAGATLAATGAETITGTLTTTLAGATVSAAGVEKFTGTLTATLAGAALSASGVETVSGTLTATLAGVTIAAVGSETIAGTLTASLDGATITATGTVAGQPVTGTLVVTLDGATLVAVAQTHPPFRDIKVLAIVDVSRLITPVDVSRNPAPLETHRELTITEEVYA